MRVFPPPPFSFPLSFYVNGIYLLGCFRSVKASGFKGEATYNVEAIVLHLYQNGYAIPVVHMLAFLYACEYRVVVGAPPC